MRPIVAAYVFGERAKPYSIAIGTAIAVGYTLATRYNDIMQLRLHPDFCEWHSGVGEGPGFCELFLEHRKNRRIPCHLKVIDDPRDPQCAYRAICVARKRLPSLDRFIPGHLERLNASGSEPVWASPCRPETWTAVLRAALLFAGCPESELESYTTHTLRRG